jgi:AsmA protein
VGKLEISDGRVTVGRANSATRPQVYDKVDLNVTDFSMSSQFPLKLSAGLPGGGKADISGKAGPINAVDAAKTPFDLAIKTNDLNLATSGFVDAASGIAGLVDLDGTLNSNGSLASAAGLITCTKLKLSPKGSPAPTPVTVRYAVNTDLATQAGTITKGDVAAGKAAAHLTGGFQNRGETQVLDLKLSAPNVPVDDLEALLPALGVVLPSGSQLKGGTLSADLAITGPVDKTVIVGPVRLTNSRLAGFDLGSKLSALSAFTGKTAGSTDTTIQNASLNAHVAPEGTRADAINLTVPAIGVITGAGTVSPAGELNFKMLADLQGGMAGGLTQMAGLGTPKGGVPFSIEGTTSNPKFVPNVSGMATSMAGQAAQSVLSGKGAKGTLSSIFGKKKP